MATKKRNNVAKDITRIKGSSGFTFRGKEYNTIREVCSYYGLSYDSVIKRRSGGYSLEEAISYYENKPIQGYTTKYGYFSTLKAIAEELNLSYSFLQNSVRQNKEKSIDNIIVLAQKNKSIVLKYKDIYWKGKVYSDINSLCKALDLKLSFLLDYAVEDLDIGVAINMAQVNKRRMSSKCIKYRGKNYTSYTEIIQSLGLNEKSIKSLVNKGYSLKDAVGLEHTNHEEVQVVIKSIRGAGFGSDIEGINFKTLAQVCAFFGTTLAHYKKQRQRGYSITKALGVTSALDKIKVN